VEGPSLRRLIERAVGEEAVAFEDASRGCDHRVTVVRTARGRSLVVRVRTAGDIGLRDEAWAIEQCARAGARVPAVRLIAALETASGPVEAMVQEAVPGRALSEVGGGLDPRRLAHVLAQAGEQLAAIHGVAAAGFGRRRGGAWDFATWDEYAAARAPDPAAPARALQAAGLPPREWETALAAAWAARRRCDRPVLCHMDLSFEHIFVDGDLRLTGVIDFGDFEGAPREVDLAFFALGEGHAALQMLLAAYRRAAGPLPADFPRNLDAACVHLAAGDLADDGGEDAESREWMAGVLRGALQRWVAAGG